MGEKHDPCWRKTKSQTKEADQIVLLTFHQHGRCHVTSKLSLLEVQRFTKNVNIRFMIAK